jgi:hypothetical protein
MSIGIDEDVSAEIQILKENKERKMKKYICEDCLNSDIEMDKKNNPQIWVDPSTNKYEYYCNYCDSFTNLLTKGDHRK